MKMHFISCEEIDRLTDQNLRRYVGCTIEDFANIFNERVRGQILSNETLKRFLEISNERHREHDKKKN